MILKILRSKRDLKQRPASGSKKAYSLFAGLNKLDFKEVFETMPGLYILLKPDSPKFTVAGVSDRYLKATMRKREDLVGLGLLDAFPPKPGMEEAHKLVHESLKTVIEKQTEHVIPLLKYDIKRPDAEGGHYEERFWTLYSKPIFIRGRLAYIIHRVKDITDVIRADRQRREYDAVMSTTPDLAYVFDLDHRFIYANPALLKMWGKQWNEAIGKNCLELGYEPWHAEMHSREIEQVIATKQPIRGEVPFKGTNGLRIYDYIFTPVFDDTGAVIAVAGTTRDVTERKQTEEALRISEERHVSALHASDFIGTWDWNLESEEVVADERFARLFSVDPELAKKGAPIISFLKAIHIGDIQRVEAAIDRSIKTRSDFSEEYRLIQPDGSIRWIQARGRVQYNQEGKAVRFPGAAVDITNRKRLQAIAESQNKALEMAVKGASLEDMLNVLITSVEENSGDVVKACVLLTDSDGKRLLHGAAPSLPKSYSQAVSGLEIGPVSGSCGTAAYLKQPVMVTDISNSPLWAPYKEFALSHQLYACWSTPIFSSDGKLIGTLGLYYHEPKEPSQNDQDIVQYISRTIATIIERANAVKEFEATQTALKESEKRFRDMADSINQMIWVTEPDGHHEYYNKRWYEYTGVPEGSTDGTQWSGVFHPDDQARAWKRWHHSLETGEPYEIEYRLRRADGIYRWTLGRAECVRDETGKIIKWYGTCTDIQDLVDAREQAQAASVAKTEFLANMSHEIRTPMNAVIGLANILSASNPLTPKQKDFIKTLQTSADSLLALINDLLDIAKIEAHTVDLEDIPFSLSDMVEDILNMMKVRANEKDLSLTFSDESVKGRHFRGDPTRIRQIVTNLCSNAIKFTEQGSVHVEITSKPGDAANIENVYITIKDTGIGIPPDKISTIFQKFTQADSSISRKYGGTGLGLAITKTLTEIMGGKISVSSKLDKGSVFEIILPLQVVEKNGTVETAKIENTQPPAKTSASGHILLVEDYAANIMVATIFIEEFGYSCDIANNGLEAFDMIKANNYDAVIMDVQMHGMNGFEATRLVREYEHQSGRKRTPIIGMTAHALAGDRERCLAIGMDDYIAKPFNPDDLKSKLQQAIYPARKTA